MRAISELWTPFTETVKEDQQHKKQLQKYTKTQEKREMKIALFILYTI